MEVSAENKEPIEFRLCNAIGFVRVMKNFAKKNKNKKIEIDDENLQILYDLLVDCKEQLDH